MEETTLPKHRRIPQIAFISLTLAASLSCRLLLFAHEPAPPSASPPKAAKRFEVRVEARWRTELRDNSDFRGDDDFDTFVGQRVRAHFRLRVHPHLSFFLQGQDVWLFGAERDHIIHNTATNLHQVFLDWSPGGRERWSVRAGRQELAYGKERLVGAFNWDNVGRSFDAARLRYRHAAWTGDFFWGRLVDIRRRRAPHRPGNRDLYGVYLSRRPTDSASRTEIYGLYFRDGLRTTGERALGPEATRIVTVGFRQARTAPAGLRYEVENAWQFGERGPDSHRGVALVANVGYGGSGRWQPLAVLEYAFGSGDDDPADGDSREFHNLFPTNHLHYGYADLIGWRNLHDLRLTASARLLPKLTVQTDYHRFLLARRRGPWKNAGGRVLGFDRTGEAGRDLGQELDLTFRVPIHQHLKFLAGYSVFLPGRFAVRTRGPETHHFGYVQTVVQF